LASQSSKEICFELCRNSNFGPEGGIGGEGRNLNFKPGKLFNLNWCIFPELIRKKKFDD
jgi:hypothetical protein